MPLYAFIRPYHSVHADQTTFTRCFQNTMYIDIGKYMSIRILVTIELLSVLSHFLCIVFTLYSTTVL